MIYNTKSQMKKFIKQYSRIYAKIDSGIFSKIPFAIRPKIASNFSRIPFRFRTYCRIFLLILCLNSPALASEDVKPASEDIQSASKDIQSASESAESSENIKPTREAIKSTNEATKSTCEAIKPASENIDLNFESSMKGMAMLF
ncbi:hypothetical protein, partial [Helicobacter sp. CLO-3]